MDFDSLSMDSLRLLIVVKAKVGEDGFCYIGWDIDRHKLRRPVLRKNSFRWLPKDHELHVGERHLFKIKSSDLDGTSFPHRTNDVLVEYTGPYDETADDSYVTELYDILLGQSHDRVEEVFGNMDKFNRKYVLESTRCSSVGIYKCKRTNLKIKYSDQGKSRCEIHTDDEGVFDYRITAADDRLPDVDINEDVLVILGLTRRSRQCQGRACFIIVVGFIFVAKCTEYLTTLSFNSNEFNYGVNGLSSESPAIGMKRKRETIYAM